jgi:hypothetical protein
MRRELAWWTTVIAAVVLIFLFYPRPRPALPETVAAAVSAPAPLPPQPIMAPQPIMTPPPMAKPEMGTTPEPSAHNYAGNVETHKFHQRSCRYFTCRNCTAYFATREEALEAGFRPCAICDP